MGIRTSKVDPELDPLQVFATPEKVGELLVFRLYDSWDPLRSHLEKLFNARASIDETTLQEYWTQETFTSYLSSQNEKLHEVIEDACSFLYRFAINQGSYPFPNINPRLTLTTFLVFIGMTTHLQEHTFVTMKWINRHRRLTKPKPIDKHRLIFQNLAKNRLGTSHSAEPDEDLLDVLCSIQPLQDFGKGMHAAWARSDVEAVARLLPGSGSTNLSGKISVDDMRTLIGFCIAVTIDQQGFVVSENNWEGVVDESVEGVLELFTAGNEEEEADGIEWDFFSRVLTQSVSYLLDPLAIFIGTSFSILETKTPAFLPLKTSQILTPSHLALLISHFGPSLPQLTTPLSQSTRFPTQLQTPPNTLIVLRSKPTNTPPTTLAIFISHYYNPPPEPDSPLPPPTTHMVALQLSPRFRLLLTGDAVVKKCQECLAVDVEDEATPLLEGGIEISDSHFRLRSRAMGVHFEKAGDVEMLEVWTSGDGA